MAKEKKARKPKGERKERVRKAYVFNIEKARKLRDEQYKDKENATATLLRGLISKNKDGYTIPEMVETGEFKGKVSEFPIPPVLFAEGVLKRTAKRQGEAKPKKPRKAKAITPKPKRVRKPRTPKLPVVAPSAQEATA